MEALGIVPGKAESYKKAYYNYPFPHIHELTESRSPPPIFIKNGNGVTSLVGIARPKLKKLTIHFLHTRTSLGRSDGGLSLQIVLFRTDLARQFQAAAATAISISVIGLEKEAGPGNISNKVAT